MRVLMSFPNVRYRRGKVTKVDANGPSNLRVTFDDGATEVFNRVVTRYGPSLTSNGKPLTRRRSRDPHAGNWLLTPVEYTLPADQENIRRRIEPAVYRVATKLDEVEARGSDGSTPLDKSMYKNLVLTGPSYFNQTDEMYKDPQAWLSTRLREGVRPNYIEDGRIEFLKRRNRSP
jgi:hypothetical protein